jgi:hypothetical protein
MNRARLEELLNRGRVRAGLLAAAAVIVLARVNWISIGAGILVSLLGLWIRAWASGHLRKEKELAVTGPYRYSRNPLYLGNFILGIGVTVGSWSLWVAVIFVVYFAVFYPQIIRRERERMRKLFPEQYEAYRRRVPSFFPSLKKLDSTGRVKFSWSLYWKNKEYRALIGAALFWAALAAKVILRARSII